MGLTENLDLLLTLFRSSYLLEKDSVEFTEDYVVTKVNLLLSIQTSLTLSDVEKQSLINSILAEFEVLQEDGIAILPDYNHEQWYYPQKISNNYFWNRYKRFLTETTDINTEDLENKVLNKVVSFLGNPVFEGSYRRRGLVIGDVQSGKTATYIGLICKAVDAGYKLIILLAGTMENLRKQTQERVDEGFIGFDTFKNELVGVGIYGKNDVTPLSLTSTDNDYTGITDRTTVLQNIDAGIPIIFVIKKNSKILSKLYEGLKSARRGKQINVPVLIIDDEADNASINTNKEDNPTKINESIRKILSICVKCNYVGFTATPFANVFIDPETQDEMLGSDLFPDDFIFAMFPPSNYIGAKKYFVENNVRNVVDITDGDLSYFQHTKDWHGPFPFQSFYDAIITFVLANVIRDIKGDLSKHRTMLINASRFSRVHYEIQNSVDEYLRLLKNSIVLNIHKSSDEYLQNKVINRIHTVWSKQYPHDITWEEVAKQIETSIASIYSVVVNSTSRNKLVYGKDKAERVIAIGGIALSRGLTLEGLIVSYFYRNTCTFDVLMQMGRWFGYRKGYADYCRVYIPVKSREWYREIAESIENLKSDMKLMVEKKLTPKDFGIRVRNDSDELGITSRSKMKSTFKKDEFREYYGNVFEAPYITDDEIQNKKHVEAVFSMAKQLTNRDYNQIHPYFRDVSKSTILLLLEQLSFSRLNNNFDVNQISRYIKDSNYPLFDVLFMEGESENSLPVVDNLSVNLLRRTFDVKVDKIDPSKKIIRSSGQRTRVGGPSDTKIGLTADQILRIKSDERLTETIVNRSRLFMLADRNPVLMIYFIELILDSMGEEARSIASKYNNTDFPLVTFAIGFPNRSLENTGNVVINGHKYIVPYKYDYYNLYGRDVDIEIEQARDVEI